MNGIIQDEEGFDEETCTPIKYQHQKDMNDWAGPHDGWQFGHKSVLFHVTVEIIQDDDGNISVRQKPED